MSYFLEVLCHVTVMESTELYEKFGVFFLIFFFFLTWSLYVA